MGIVDDESYEKAPALTGAKATITTYKMRVCQGANGEKTRANAHIGLNWGAGGKDQWVQVGYLRGYDDSVGTNLSYGYYYEFEITVGGCTEHETYAWGTPPKNSPVDFKIDRVTLQANPPDKRWRVTAAGDSETYPSSGCLGCTGASSAEFVTETSHKETQCPGDKNHKVTFLTCQVQKSGGAFGDFTWSDIPRGLTETTDKYVRGDVDNPGGTGKTFTVHDSRFTDLPP